ncbi:hypothetical protein PYCCODRAFT_13680 [Trametes coccinea BRFM310]|uniref:Uncharacterized protein n=1 Tax=Trametes coccinea (strain BRFM310) TaxID=1353009 RepID=A0A1Y2J4M3_TRAC3|nr:hypothetical protein PYCCODRAFT_13680 [Trametes coccinea BRFM310]
MTGLLMKWTEARRNRAFFDAHGALVRRPRARGAPGRHQHHSVGDLAAEMGPRTRHTGQSSCLARALISVHDMWYYICTIAPAAPPREGHDIYRRRKQQPTLKHIQAVPCRASARRRRTARSAELRADGRHIIRCQWARPGVRPRPVVHHHFSHPTRLTCTAQAQGRGGNSMQDG